MARKHIDIPGQESLLPPDAAKAPAVDLDPVAAGIAATRAALGTPTPPTDPLSRLIEHQKERYAPIATAELAPLDRFERLMVTRNTSDFMAASRAEQVEAMQGSVPQPGGIAKHLAEVARRKVKEGDADPGRAPRAIVRSYIEWANDAVVAQAATQSVAEELAQDVNPELRLDRVFPAPEPRLLPLLREVDLMTLRETHDVNAIGYDPQKVDYSPENGGIMAHLEMAQEQWIVGKVRRLLPSVVSLQAARQAFWTAQLRDVAKHSPKQLAAIAHQGLEGLQTATTQV